MIYNDILRNKRNTKGLVFIVFFRVSNFFTKNVLLKIIGIPIRILYKLIIQWVMGIDVPDKTKILSGCVVYHGQGLVIHENTIIGQNVILRHNTTIGNKCQFGGAPVIGDNVEIGANSVIIGEIYIGSNSKIAAGSVIINNVPENCVAAGNPGKILKKINK